VSDAAELIRAARAFYASRVPDQFNATLARQRSVAANDPAATRLLEEMEAVRSSIVVQVDADGSLERFAYDIERGVMSSAEAPSYTPFMVLGHSLSDFENLRRECGDSLLGFLGGLAGLGDDMRLTSSRVRSLRELAGSLAFERVGAGGFVLFAHFGVDTHSSEPRATIRINAETYARLRAGELDPQDAFLAGQVELEGDEGMAIELALTALSPD
jgi:hypothetical protein